MHGYATFQFNLDSEGVMGRNRRGGTSGTIRICARVGFKNPTQKTHPKNPKKPPKNPLKMFFLGFFEFF
jgi:hypothetical protein